MLAGHVLDRDRVAARFQQRLGEGDFRGAIDLRLQPVGLRLQGIVLLAHGVEIGLRGRVVEKNQRLAGLDLLRFPDEDFLDDAPGQMLDDFPLRLHGHRSRGGHALVEGREKCPQQESQQACSQDGEADDRGAAGIRHALGGFLQVAFRERGVFGKRLLGAFDQF